MLSCTGIIHVTFLCLLSGLPTRIHQQLVILRRQLSHKYCQYCNSQSLSKSEEGSVKSVAVNEPPLIVIPGSFTFLRNISILFAMLDIIFNLFWHSDAIWPLRSESTLFRLWLVAWRHQAITWTNVDISSINPTDIHVRRTAQEIPQSSSTKISLKFTYAKFH